MRKEVQNQNTSISSGGVKHVDCIDDPRNILELLPSTKYCISELGQSVISNQRMTSQICDTKF